MDKAISLYKGMVIQYLDDDLVASKGTNFTIKEIKEDGRIVFFDTAWGLIKLKSESWKLVFCPWIVRGDHMPVKNKTVLVTLGNGDISAAIMSDDEDWIGAGSMTDYAQDYTSGDEYEIEVPNELFGVKAWKYITDDPYVEKYTKTTEEYLKHSGLDVASAIYFTCRDYDFITINGFNTITINKGREGREEELTAFDIVNRIQELYAMLDEETKQKWQSIVDDKLGKMPLE